MDLKQRIIASGLTVEAVARRAETPTSHLYNLLRGIRRPRIELAKRIELATDGLIRWVEFFDGPVPLHMEAAAGEPAPAIVSVNDEGSAAPADAPGAVLVVPSEKPNRQHHRITAA